MYRALLTVILHLIDTWTKALQSHVLFQVCPIEKSCQSHSKLTASTETEQHYVKTVMTAEFNSASVAQPYNSFFVLFSCTLSLRLMLLNEWTGPDVTQILSPAIHHINYASPTDSMVTRRASEGHHGWPAVMNQPGPVKWVLHNRSDILECCPPCGYSCRDVESAFLVPGFLLWSDHWSLGVLSGIQKLLFPYWLD